MKTYKKEVPFQGEVCEVEIRMWSARQRDEVERHFGTPGSRYLSGLVGIIGRSRPAPATLGLMQQLIEREVKRLNEIGISQTVATIKACVVNAPFSLEDNDLLEMDQDEFSALADAVQSVIWRVDDRVLLLKEELAKVLKGKTLEKAHDTVDAVFSGRAEKNGSPP
jgi:hypothetical protein